MEAFFGTWKFVKSENIHDLIGAYGLNDDARRVGSVVKPVITISQEDDCVVINTKTIISQREICFRLGEEFDDQTIDGKLCKAIINLEGGKLVQVQKHDDKETTSVREIQNGNMITTVTCDGNTAVFTYEKE